MNIEINKLYVKKDNGNFVVKVVETNSNNVKYETSIGKGPKVSSKVPKGYFIANFKPKE